MTGCLKIRLARLVIAALAILVAAGAVEPAAAQASDPAARVVSLVRKGEARIDAGAQEEGRALLEQAAQLARTLDESRAVTRLLPDLALARMYYDLADWTRAASFAKPVVAGLDTPENESHINRLEALAILGFSLFMEGEKIEAEAVLRRAVAATRDRSEARFLYHMALATLAIVAAEENTGDAAEIVAEARRELSGSDDIAPSFLARILHADLLRRRAAGAEPETLVADAEALAELATPQSGISPEQRTYYQSIFGLILMEAGQAARAEPLLRARFLFLDTPEGRRNPDYLFSGQRLGVVLALLGRRDEAIALMQRLVAEASAAANPDYEAIASLERETAYAMKAEGVETASQTHYLRAYEALRQVRTINDPAVLELRGRITTETAMRAGGRIAAELGEDKRFQFRLSETGDDILRLFLAGRYRVMNDLLDEIQRAIDERSKTESPDPDRLVTFALNRALAEALLGHLDESMRRLSHARAIAARPGASDGIAHSKAFDLIEAIARVWGSSQDPDRAHGALRRLAARDDLSTEMKSFVMALETFTDFQQERPARVLLGLGRWNKADDRPRKATVWGLFTDTLVIEMAFSELETADAEKLFVAAQRRAAEMPDLVFAAKYERFARLLNGQDLNLGEDALLEMSRLARELRALVPPRHPVQAALRIGFANALWANERYPEAYTAMREAAALYRSDPYHRKDVQAFFLAQLALIKKDMGDRNLYLAFAKQAYEATDPETARPDLAEVAAATYIDALAEWGEYDSARAVARRLMEDQRLMAVLSPANRIDFLIRYGRALIEDQSLDEARRVVTRALETIPYEGFNGGVVRSNILYTRAFLETRAGNAAAAYRDISRSNRIYQSYRAGLASHPAGSRAFEVWRVRAEAAIGWMYSQTLPAESP